MTERMVPFFCPYCGEVGLVPSGAGAGEWQCRDCRRSFVLRTVVRTSEEAPA